jgi:hypothetical protein
MAACSHCGAQFNESGNFCPVCGAPAILMYSQQQPYRQPLPYSQPPYSREPPYPQPPPLYSQPSSPQWQQQPVPSSSPHHAVAHGFAQMFGLHPAMALLTVAVNAMIFGDALLSIPAGIFTLGLTLAQLVAVSITCGGILGFITHRAQTKWYGDDKESALIKALIVGFLTAIPVGLPGFLVIPSGIVGLFRKKT